MRKPFDLEDCKLLGLGIIIATDIEASDEDFNLYIAATKALIELFLREKAKQESEKQS